MGGICSFFIEFKLFQLVAEEGGSLFSLCIFEQGKHFMKSVFMGKNATVWLMKNIEHTVVGINPKQFFTLMEGDTAYTLQQGTNSFGQFLLVSELKVGGPQTICHYPQGKAHYGWKVFGLELRKMLELDQYALGGLGQAKFVSLPQRGRLGLHPSWSFVEILKGASRSLNRKWLRKLEVWFLIHGVPCRQEFQAAPSIFRKWFFRFSSDQKSFVISNMVSGGLVSIDMRAVTLKFVPRLVGPSFPEHFLEFL